MPTEEITRVIDAKLVLFLTAIFTILIIPLVRWLGAVAVKSAFERITGLDKKLEEASLARNALERTSIGMSKDIASALASAGYATEKAAEVDSAQQVLALEHGKLEGRVTRAETDIRDTDKEVQKIKDHLTRAGGHDE